MILTAFTNAKALTGRTKVLDWPGLVSFLGHGKEQHLIHGGTKDQLPAFSPAEFQPGEPRFRRNVQRVHFGVLDFDGVPEVRVGHTLDMMVHEGVQGLFYTTWSHAKRPGWSVRVIVPFTRAVEALEWDHFWPVFHDTFGGLADPMSKDMGRIYFGAYCPPGTAPIFRTWPGKPLDVDRLLIRDMAQCGVCGFDHSYEQAEAQKAHHRE